MCFHVGISNTNIVDIDNDVYIVYPLSDGLGSQPNDVNDRLSK
jgi:hypothetical protein